MDPTTTLVTFMLQTHPAVKSVHLCGSWDNFSKQYTMERDSRRDRGQWRGCYSFKDITCDGDTSTVKRNGGLKMGQTYYYYYELNGSCETYDPTAPSTNQCPFLPGQTVNMLDVPVEYMLRKRSASLNSMRITDFRTMNPSDKFVSPRPPPPVPGSPLPLRAGTAPLSLGRKRSSRSLSPAPGSQFSWSARRLFGLRPRDSERGRADSLTLDDQRSYTPSEGSSRSRDISPESLRRFLQDDGPCSLQTTPEEELPCFNIPEDIAEEEDDDNFATSAVSESRPFPTLLSPPPLRNTAPTSIVGSADASEMSAPAQDEKPKGDDAFPVSRFSMSSIASSFAPPASPRSAAGDEQDPPSFFDDSNDDEDELYSQPDEDEDEVDRFTFRPLQVNIDGLDGAAGTSFGSSASLFSGYTLPRAAETAPDGSPDRKRAATVSLLRPSQPADDIMNALGSPALVARNAENGGMPMGNTSLLAAPTDSGLDDLVQELGWMADVISGKR